MKRTRKTNSNSNLKNTDKVPVRKYRGKSGTKPENCREESFDPRSKENDVSWYAQNSQLMSDVASFSYNYPLGGKMPSDTNASKFWRNTSVPGIMTIHTTPRFGRLEDANDPLNVAMRNVYSYVRHANSGSTNYEAPDMMLYLVAMDSCFSFIEALKRVYGTLLTYSYSNRYFPVAAVHAQGFNFADLHENIADFRAYINTLAVKVGSMCIPASMSYMARHQWMYSGMYYDTPENSKAQVYMYVPEAFYRYTLDADGAGACVLLDFDRTRYGSDYVYPINDGSGTRGWTFRDIVAFGDALIDPILADEDMNIMSGDILKAFTPSNVYMISTIPENYSVVPVYSQEVLNQIHNTTLLGRSIQPNYRWDALPTITKDNSLVQSADKTYLLNRPHASFILPYQIYSGSNPEYALDWQDEDFWTNTNKDEYFKLWLQTAATKRLLDFEAGPVTPGDALVASRLTTTLDTDDALITAAMASIDSEHVGSKYHGMIDGGTDYFWLHGTIASCGSETAGYAKIWYWANVGYNSANDWCLIHTEDIYTGMWMVATVNMTDQYYTDWADLRLRLQSNQQVAVAEFSFQRKAMLSAFNMHPVIFDALLAQQNVTADSASYLVSNGTTWPQGDVNYYTVLDEADLHQMHEVALMSEFAVTQYGRKA